MRLHRFYINPKQHELTERLWINEQSLLDQWRKVLRYQMGQQVVLFDGLDHERLYKITELKSDAARLERVTDMTPKVPEKDLYLAWALLKKDKNEWVLQKCTELGVNHFIPILSERCEKTGFNDKRAQKIILEAAEQCGRGNIPSLREPIHVTTLLDEFIGKLPIIVCEQEGSEPLDKAAEKAVVVIGPEGGWTDDEKALFRDKSVSLVSIGDFTHRAETASIAAISKLL